MPMFFGLGYQRRHLLLPLLVGFCLMGCVRVEADREPSHATRLVVTRDTKGVNMQFQSDAKLNYTIYYRDPGVANDAWKPLPNATEIAGTGELVMFNDPSPTAFRRKYRIQTLVPIQRKDLKK